ncbi:MAG TPA: hypothetical protein VMU80_14930 [Bryobacteraceae bacterium]|nr:hypothetical protein [Bryobacteraceae bacterium]
MFQLFTQEARRAIFFARYEAGLFGSPKIETEHLLLGMCRPEHPLPVHLPPGSAGQIQKLIEERIPKPARSTATPVDLPVTQDLKPALAYAQEESDAGASLHRLCPPAAGPPAD